MFRALKEFAIIVSLIIAGLFAIAVFARFNESDDSASSSKTVSAVTSAPAESASSGVAHRLTDVSTSDVASTSANGSHIADQPCTDVDSGQSVGDAWVQVSQSMFTKRDIECDGLVLMAFSEQGVPHLVLAQPGDPNCARNGAINTYTIDGQPMRFVSYCMPDVAVEEPASFDDQREFVRMATSANTLTMKLLLGSSIHFRLDGTRAVLMDINEAAVQQVKTAQAPPWSE